MPAWLPPLCRRALVHHGILYFPGSMYGTEGEGYARISFLAPPAQHDQALDRFARMAEAPSPGVSVSCSQLASPGSCVMRAACLESG